MSIEQTTGAIWLRMNWSKLRIFNFEWVAASGDGLIAHATELEVVMNHVIEKDLVNQAVYALVDFIEVKQ